MARRSEARRTRARALRAAWAPKRGARPPSHKRIQYGERPARRMGDPSDQAAPHSMRSGAPVARCPVLRYAAHLHSIP